MTLTDAKKAIQSGIYARDMATGAALPQEEADAKLRELLKPIISSNNRLISSANKQETIGQQFVYEGHAMERTRTPGDRYYLPEGRFTVEGLTGDELRQKALDAVGFNNLKGVRARDAMEEYRRVKGELRKWATADAVKERAGSIQVIATAEGMWKGAELADEKSVTPEKFATRKQYRAARKRIKARNQKIREDIRDINGYFSGLGPKEVSRMYSEYRRWLQFLKAQGAEEYADYEANNDNYTPEAVFSRAMRDNLGTIRNGGDIAGWEAQWERAYIANKKLQAGQLKTSPYSGNISQQQADVLAFLDGLNNTLKNPNNPYNGKNPYER